MVNRRRKIRQSNDADESVGLSGWLYTDLMLGLAVVLAVVGGALVGGVGRISGRLGRHQPLPFGPFLAAGGLVVWLGGPALWIRFFGMVS